MSSESRANSNADLKLPSGSDAKSSRCESVASRAVAQSRVIQPSPVRSHGTIATTPDALVAKIKETVGEVPGLDGAAPPAPAPTPAPATAP